MTTLREKFEKHKNFRPRKFDIQLHNKCLAILDGEVLQIDSYFNGWHILKNIEGLYIFNWYNYSNTTRKHQWSAKQLCENLGVEYIEFNSGNGLKYDCALRTIIESKIEELYSGENNLALSKATKYAVFSEADFDNLMKDIQTIAKHTKMKNAELDKLMIEAEDKATVALFDTLFRSSERKDSMKVVRAEMENFEAVAV